MAARAIPAKVRFWRRVRKTATCWLWTGRVNNRGYPEFPSCRPRRLGPPRYTSVLAHRQAWMWAFGAIAPGLDVMHRCDTPRCVRPTHLRLGTHQHNMADMVTKGRNPRGERNGRATRLNAVAVRVIHTLAARGVPSARLAAAHGVRTNYVERILNGSIWQEAKR